MTPVPPPMSSKAHFRTLDRDVLETRIEELRAELSQHLIWVSGRVSGGAATTPIPQVQTLLDQAAAAQTALQTAEDAVTQAIDARDAAIDARDDNQVQQDARRTAITTTEADIVAAQAKLRAATDPIDQDSYRQEVANLSSRKAGYEQQLDPLMPGSLAHQRQQIEADILRLDQGILDAQRNRTAADANVQTANRAVALAASTSTIEDDLRDQISDAQDVWIEKQGKVGGFAFNHPRLRHPFRGAKGLPALPGETDKQRGFFQNHPILAKIRNWTLVTAAAVGIGAFAIPKILDATFDKPDTPPGLDSGDAGVGLPSSGVILPDQEACETELTARDGATTAVKVAYAHHTGMLGTDFDILSQEQIDQILAIEDSELDGFVVEDVQFDENDALRYRAQTLEVLEAKAAAEPEGCIVGDAAFEEATRVMGCVSVDGTCDLATVERNTGIDLGNR